MDLSFLERLDELEARYARFSMVGTDNVLVAGNLKTGFTVNVNPDQVDLGSSSEPVGACCIGVDCSIVTRAYCNSHGGTYYGDGTPCSATPCSGVICPIVCIGGACCQPFACTQVADVAGCAAIGGIYHGDGTCCEATVGIFCADPSGFWMCPPNVVQCNSGACCAIFGGCFDVASPGGCDTSYGAGTFLGFGTSCNNYPCGHDCWDEFGACCFDLGGGSFNCYQTSKASCVDAGGGFQGDGVLCCDGCPSFEPISCPPVVGACCCGTSPYDCRNSLDCPGGCEDYGPGSLCTDHMATCCGRNTCDNSTNLCADGFSFCHTTSDPQTPCPPAIYNCMDCFCFTCGDTSCVSPCFGGTSPGEAHGGCCVTQSCVAGHCSINGNLCTHDSDCANCVGNLTASECEALPGTPLGDCTCCPNCNCGGPSTCPDGYTCSPIDGGCYHT